jgi:hypothetical protein
MTTYNQLKYPASSIGNSSIATGAVSPDKLDSNAQRMGFKNRIINGDMRIAQQYGNGSGAATTGGVASYPIDRFYYAQTPATSKFTIQQNAGSVTPPIGFSNYEGITSTSAYTVLTNEIFIFEQKIEGQNVSDLAWGTANAKPITLSFWVYSSLTGTFSGSLRNYADTRNYVYSYTISTANTWTQIAVTIPGDTAGTWTLYGNGVGVKVGFCLGAGSAFLTTAGSWGTTTVVGSTSTTNVMGTNGATWYVTGVQFELGSQATSFDFRSIGTELALCQRYYNILIGGGVNTYQNIGCFYTPTRGFTNVSFKVSMRTTPSIINNSLYMNCNTNSATYHATVTSIYPGTQQTGIDLAVTGAPAGSAFSADVNSGSLACTAEL